MAKHSELIGSELHDPKGHSRTGLALDLEAATANAFVVEDENGDAWLTFDTSEDKIQLGGTTGTPPKLRAVLPANNANALLVEDASGNDYVRLDTTTGAVVLAFGNATTNPGVRWYGTGQWTDGAGSTGTNGQVWTRTANGPRWV